MSELIFNPKKDMKELEKYGFKLIKNQWQYICSSKDCYFINTYDSRITLLLINKEITNEMLILHYKLIKENFIIDEEELKNESMD